MTNPIERTPLKDIAAYMADAHAQDPLNEGGWDGSDEALHDELRAHLRTALQVEADIWADAQAEKDTAARIEAALDTLRDASAGQVCRCEDGAVYQPCEIGTWVSVDDDELEQLGAAVLAGEEGAYSLWATQCGVALETTRDMPAEAAILEAAGKGDER